jgi:hypothetical protein
MADSFEASSVVKIIFPNILKRTRRRPTLSTIRH